MVQECKQTNGIETDKTVNLCLFSIHNQPPIWLKKTSHMVPFVLEILKYQRETTSATTSVTFAGFLENTESLVSCHFCWCCTLQDCRL